MNAEGQLDTDEDGEEEAEGIPEAVAGSDDPNRAEGAVAQIVEDLGQQLVEDLVLRYNKVDGSNMRNNDAQEEEIRPNNEGNVEDRILQEEDGALDRNIIQGIHPAFAPMAPPPAPILLRRASTSSLDESSQRTSCKTSNDLYTDPIGASASGSGHRPSYQNPNNPGRVLDRLRELRNNNELCDVTLVAGGHEVNLENK